MQVNIRFVGSLARKFGREVTIELDDGTTFATAVKQISEKYGLGSIDLERGDNQGYYVILLNGRSQKASVRLKEMDEIAFLPTIAGG